MHGRPFSNNPWMPCLLAAVCLVENVCSTPKLVKNTNLRLVDFSGIFATLRVSLLSCHTYAQNSIESLCIINIRVNSLWSKFTLFARQIVCMMHLTLVNDTRSILPDIYPDLNINQVIYLNKY